MKKYIYLLLILACAVGIIIVAPLKNHFMVEAQILRYGPMFWGQPSGWWGGYGFQMAPLAWFPQAEIASYNPYTPFDPRIASDPRFTPPRLTPGPGMSGGGLGYFGGGSEPVPFGTPTPPYEPYYNTSSLLYTAIYYESEFGPWAYVDWESNQWIIIRDGKVIGREPYIGPPNSNPLWDPYNPNRNIVNYWYPYYYNKYIKYPEGRRPYYFPGET